MVLAVVATDRYYEERRGFMNNAIKQRHAPSAERGRDWREDAACLKVDPELFFIVGAIKAGTPQYRQAERAKAVCAQCSVSEACLQYALETDQNEGIWGGMTEDERRELRRRARRGRRMGHRATSEIGAIL